MTYVSIKGFNGRYGVSIEGSVCSFLIGSGKGISEKPTRILAQSDNKGYKRVSLRKLKWDDPIEGKYVHRLVAEAFLQKPDNINLYEVNHIDGNKSNNHVSNLEWVSRQENIDHAWETNLITSEALKEKGLTLYIATSIANGKVYKFYGGRELSAAGFRRDGVTRNIRGLRKQYKGFTWDAIKSPAINPIDLGKG